MPYTSFRRERGQHSDPRSFRSTWFGLLWIELAQSHALCMSVDVPPSPSCNSAYHLRGVRDCTIRSPLKISLTPESHTQRSLPSVYFAAEGYAGSRIPEEDLKFEKVKCQALG